MQYYKKIPITKDQIVPTAERMRKDGVILAIKGIGPKRLEEIRRALAEIQQDRD